MDPVVRFVLESRFEFLECGEYDERPDEWRWNRENQVDHQGPADGAGFVEWRIGCQIPPVGEESDIDLKSDECNHQYDGGRDLDRSVPCRHAFVLDQINAQHEQE